MAGGGGEGGEVPRSLLLPCFLLKLNICNTKKKPKAML
jgi:hypothetical protein